MQLQMETDKCIQRLTAEAGGKTMKEHKTKQYTNKHECVMDTELECKRYQNYTDQINYFVSYFKHFEENYAWTKELQGKEAKQNITI